MKKNFKRAVATFLLSASFLTSTNMISCFAKGGEGNKETSNSSEMEVLDSSEDGSIESSYEDEYFKKDPDYALAEDIGLDLDDMSKDDEYDFLTYKFERNLFLLPNPSEENILKALDEYIDALEVFACNIKNAETVTNNDLQLFKQVKCHIAVLRDLKANKGTIASYIPPADISRMNINLTSVNNFMWLRRIFRANLRNYNPETFKKSLSDILYEHINSLNESILNTTDPLTREMIKFEILRSSIMTSKLLEEIKNPKKKEINDAEILSLSSYFSNIIREALLDNIFKFSCDDKNSEATLGDKIYNDAENKIAEFCESRGYHCDNEIENELAFLKNNKSNLHSICEKYLGKLDCVNCMLAWKMNKLFKIVNTLYEIDKSEGKKVFSEVFFKITNLRLSSNMGSNKEYCDYFRESMIKDISKGSRHSKECFSEIERKLSACREISKESFPDLWEKYDNEYNVIYKILFGKTQIKDFVEYIGIAEKIIARKDNTDDNTKNRLDKYAMMLISKYFNTPDDYINLEKTCKEYRGIVDQFHYNPIPIFNEKEQALFKNIETAYYYGDKKEILDDATGKIKEQREYKIPIKGKVTKRINYREIDWNLNKKLGKYTTHEAVKLNDDFDYKPRIPVDENGKCVTPDCVTHIMSSDAYSNMRYNNDHFEGTIALPKNLKYISPSAFGKAFINVDFTVNDLAEGEELVFDFDVPLFIANKLEKHNVKCPHKVFTGVDFHLSVLSNLYYTKSGNKKLFPKLIIPDTVEKVYISNTDYRGVNYKYIYVPKSVKSIYHISDLFGTKPIIVVRGIENAGYWDCKLPAHFNDGRLIVMNKSAEIMYIKHIIQDVFPMLRDVNEKNKLIDTLKMIIPENEIIDLMNGRDVNCEQKQSLEFKEGDFSYEKLDDNTVLLKMDKCIKKHPKTVTHNKETYNVMEPKIDFYELDIFWFHKSEKTALRYIRPGVYMLEASIYPDHIRQTTDEDIKKLIITHVVKKFDTSNDDINTEEVEVVVVPKSVIKNNPSILKLPSLKRLIIIDDTIDIRIRFEEQHTPIKKIEFQKSSFLENELRDVLKSDYPVVEIQLKSWGDRISNLLPNILTRKFETK